MSLTCLERQKLSVIKKLRENVANTRPEGQVQDVNYAGKDLERRHSKLRNTMAIKSFGMNITPGCLACGLRVVFVSLRVRVISCSFSFCSMILVNAVIIIRIHFTDCTKVVDSKNESIGYGFF